MTHAQIWKQQQTQVAAVATETSTSTSTTTTSTTTTTTTQTGEIESVGMTTTSNASANESGSTMNEVWRNDAMSLVPLPSYRQARYIIFIRFDNLIINFNY